MPLVLNPIVMQVSKLSSSPESFLSLDVKQSFVGVGENWLDAEPTEFAFSQS